MKSRIAPTPSGFLHRGNAFNFLLTYQIVRARQGQLLLRIDDIDRGRYRPAYVEHIFKTVDALGIEIDQGPRNLAELEAEWSQHHRLPHYETTLKKLIATGRVYACDCSRKQVNAQSIDGKYAGTCRERRLPLGQAGLNWRINTEGVESTVLPGFSDSKRHSLSVADTMGDFVVRKKDGLPAYQICSLTDDLLFGIDLIVRGEDLLSSSAAQIWLAELLEATDWLARLKMLHHALLLGADGNKLSKSAGAMAIETGEGEDIGKLKKMLLEEIDRLGL